MRRAWHVFAVVVSVVGAVSGQDVSPPASIKPHSAAAPAVGPPAAGLAVPAKVADEQNTYVIEMRVLEGTKPLGNDPVIRDLIRPATKAVQGDNLPDRVSPPRAARAILPHPARSPASDALRANAAPNKAEEDLWRDTLGRPGVTVVAAPELAVVARQPATIQIQTEQIFSYLVPLGSGKFEAKHTPAQVLGMKFTLELQPVDGDEKVVEISPLEVQLSVFDGREPVEGLDLEVGKPIIATRSLKTTATMKLGATRMIELPSGPKTQAALLLRVKRMNAPERQSAWQPDGQSNISEALGFAR